MLDVIKKARFSTNLTTVLILLGALVYMGFTFDRDKVSALAQAPLVIGFATWAVKMVHQGDATEAKADEAAKTAAVAANTATQAAAQSLDNGTQLATIDSKIDENTVKTDAKIDENTIKTDAVHDLVNGAATAARESAEEMSRLRVEQAEQRAAIAALIERDRSKQAEIDALKAGIETGRQQVIDETAAQESRV